MNLFGVMYQDIMDVGECQGQIDSSGIYLLNANLLFSLLYKIPCRRKLKFRMRHPLPLLPWPQGHHPCSAAHNPHVKHGDLQCEFAEHTELLLAVVGQQGGASPNPVPPSMLGAVWGSLGVVLVYYK